MNPPDSAARQAWERDKQNVYDNFTQNAPRVRLPDGEEMKRGDAFEYGYLYGYEAAQADARISALLETIARYEQDCRHLYAESAAKEARIVELETGIHEAQEALTRSLEVLHPGDQRDFTHLAQRLLEAALAGAGAQDQAGGGEGI